MLAYCAAAEIPELTCLALTIDSWARSAALMTDWFTAQTSQFRRQVEVVPMDGFGGYKTAATSAVLDAVTVMDTAPTCWPT